MNKRPPNIIQILSSIEASLQASGRAILQPEIAFMRWQISALQWINQIAINDSWSSLANGLSTCLGNACFLQGALHPPFKHHPSKRNRIQECQPRSDAHFTPKKKSYHTSFQIDLALMRGMGYGQNNHEPTVKLANVPLRGHGTIRARPLVLCRL